MGLGNYGCSVKRRVVNKCMNTEKKKRDSERGQTHIGLSSLAPRDSLKVANITRDLQIVTQLGATTRTVGSSEGEE